MEQVWRSGQYTGADRAMARVTVQRPKMALRDYALQSTFSRLSNNPSLSIKDLLLAGATLDPGKPSPVAQTYADFLFSAEEDPLELPSVRTVSWDRTVDTDAASATIVLANFTAPVAGGLLQFQPQTIDIGGAFTFDHGRGAFAEQWSQQVNEFAGMIMPDNIIRTYEGYGADFTVAPEKDPNLVLTGVWLIDDVDMANDSGGPVITITARDTMRLLTDHFAVAPVVPDDFYPLSFQDWDDPQSFTAVRTTGNYGRVDVKLRTTSNSFWTPPGSAPNATLQGHKPSHALDDDPKTYWVSIGNVAPTKRFAYEWVEVGCDATVSEVRFSTKLSGYSAFVSVYANGRWQGTQKINYARDGIGRNDADIAYVATGNAPTEAEQKITFTPIEGATRVRLTLSNLQNHGFGAFKYRAGLRSFQVWSNTVASKNESEIKQLTPGPAGSNPGRASDFTDIVKLLCAWAGLHWPQAAYLRNSDGTLTSVPFTDDDDDVLGHIAGVGRVWGDFQSTGTMAVAELKSGKFDQQTLLQGIREVKDITGFVLFADESGAIQWRLSNLYDIGNWLTGLSATPGRTQAMHSIGEEQLLTAIRAKLSSKNVREQIFVASPAMDVAAVVAGFNPNYVGLRRTAGWTDSDFKSQVEVQTMADMIAVRQLFTYRTVQATIPGFPGIQVDDQVQLIERTTSEGHVHYVKGISSSNDLRTGKWDYTLQTHWLGDRAGESWLMDTGKLEAVTADYISMVGTQSPFIETRIV